MRCIVFNTQDYTAMEAEMADGDAEEAAKKAPKQGRLKRGARPGAQNLHSAVSAYVWQMLARHLAAQPH